MPAPARSVCLLAALAVPCAGFPQAAIEPDPSTDQHQELLEQVATTVAEGSLRSPDLIEPLTTLGLQHLERGEHDQAAAAFEKARYLVRANHGLSTLDEVLLLSYWVRAEEARGNIDGAWMLERDLVTLARGHLGELSTVPIFRALAEKRLDIFDRYRSGERPPQIVLGCYYARSGYIDSIRIRDSLMGAYPRRETSCNSGDRHTVLVALMTEARSYQALAIDALLRNGRYSSDELRDLVTDVLRSSDQLQRLVPEYGDSFIREVLGGLLAYEPKDSASSVRRSEILIQVADWNVIRAHRAGRFPKHKLVLQQYEEAYELLEKEGRERTSIEEIFSPRTPVVLPAYGLNPLVSMEGSQSRGYVDVAFDVTKYGKSKRIRILDASAEVPPAAKKELVRTIKRSSFRPRVVDGRIADASRVTMRYYLGDQWGGDRGSDRRE